MKAKQGKETREAQAAQATTPASLVQEDEGEEAEATLESRLPKHMLTTNWSTKVAKVLS